MLALTTLSCRGCGGSSKLVATLTSDNQILRAATFYGSNKALAKRYVHENPFEPKLGSSPRFSGDFNPYKVESVRERVKRVAGNVK